MRGFGLASAVASLFVGSVVAAVDPIVIKGSKFFYKTNGTQFYIRGVAYQADYLGVGAIGGNTAGGYNDPLANPNGCTRDIPYLKQLRTNTIRVYALNPAANHDACMNMLADAGIYVIADLSAPTDSIDSNSPSWNDQLYARYASVVDSMQGYTNTLGFFGGNEVATQPNNTASSAFVKAAVRDTKSYIKSKGYRTIGVGYATNDNSAIRVDLANYMNCGDPADAVDFWGYNVYSWCGDSNYVTSGYNIRTQEFQTYSVPSFFAEYGCNKITPRPFTEVAALFGPKMSPVWSGGIVYMYFQETNDFGLVSTVGSNSISTLADFNNLKTQMAKVSPTGVNMNAYTPSNSPASCPVEGPSFSAKATPLPPSPNQELCSCMTKSLSCVVNPSADPSKYQVAYSYIGKHDSGAFGGVAHDGTTAKYGAYSMCSPAEQLSFVLDAYYKDQGSKSTACAFNGLAQVQSPSQGSSTCKNLIAQAGKGGTGTVTSAPSGTGAGSAGSSGSAASSSGSAGMNTVPSSENGLFPMVFIVTLAALSGMGILLL